MSFSVEIKHQTYRTSSSSHCHPEEETATFCFSVERHGDIRPTHRLRTVDTNSGAHNNLSRVSVLLLFDYQNIAFLSTHSTNHLAGKRNEHSMEVITVTVSITVTFYGQTAEFSLVSACSGLLWSTFRPKTRQLLVDNEASRMMSCDVQRRRFMSEANNDHCS